MAKTQTRMDSATRRQLVLMHNIKPVVQSPESRMAIESSRKTGNLVASRMNAVLARRASFHTA